jgi:hypothetical protein
MHGLWAYKISQDRVAVVALQSTRSFMKMQYSMTPKAAYFVVETRLIELLV